MKKLLPLFLLLATCTASCSAKAPETIGKDAGGNYAGDSDVAGSWLSNGPQEQFELALSSDNTYQFYIVGPLVAPTFFGAQEEAGTYSSSNGTIDFIPRQTSCSGTDPQPYTADVSVDNGFLSLNFSLKGEVIIFQSQSGPVPVCGNDDAGGCQIAIGCITSGGFQEEPLADIMP